MGEMADWYAEQAEGQHEDKMNGTGGYEDPEYLASLGIEIIEDEVDEFADVPQGKPAGLRLGGDAERRLTSCPTCRGAGTYPVTVFGAMDANGERHPEVKNQVCATCFGRGKITEVVR